MKCEGQCECVMIEEPRASGIDIDSLDAITFVAGCLLLWILIGVLKKGLQ